MDLAAHVVLLQKQSWRLLELHPISVDFSFLLTGGVVSDEEQSGEPSDDNFIRDFLRAVGVAVSNIDGVPFRMNALILSNVFSTQESLTQEIVHHYTMEGIREGLKVLGCLDLIGNPVKLFGHLGDGITDLYYEPLLEGMQSMAANTVAGAAGFVTSITGTVGNSLAVLSMDDDFQRARKHDAARHRTVAGQLEHGGIQFARSLYEGATGIFLQPLKGARSEGAKGFFKVCSLSAPSPCCCQPIPSRPNIKKRAATSTPTRAPILRTQLLMTLVSQGVGKGLIGVVAKPLSGIVDLTTTTIDSVRRLAHDDEVVPAYRLPRCIRPDKVRHRFAHPRPPKLARGNTSRRRLPPGCEDLLQV